MKLTNTAVKNARPKAKPYKLADGGGLYLLSALSQIDRVHIALGR